MELPPLHRRAQLLAEGYSPAELRRLLHTGALTPVRPGAYLTERPPEHAVARHALAARAVLDQLGDGAVFSHVTAAVLHGLPVWDIPLGQVHATRSRRAGGRRSRAVRLHSAAVAAGETEIVAGLPVTGLARTVLDLARALRFEPAVCLADAVLRGDRRDGGPAGSRSIRRSSRRRWTGRRAGRASRRPAG